MTIRKVVIPAAGLGTRLLTATKETPKEMLPIFSTNNENEMTVKPLLQVVFEQLYDFGFREFCFVVGRGKRAVEDHFTQDAHFISELISRNKRESTKSLEKFYTILDDSMITWINQSEPRGFGDAVLRAQTFVGEEPFIVHAGDTVIFSKNNEHFLRLSEGFNVDGCSILLKRVEDGRQYGIAEIKDGGKIFRINSVVEKPKKPTSPWAIMPLYIFDSSIFERIKSVTPDHTGEVQLTAGIQKLIEDGKKVMGIPMKPEDLMLDIGTPKMYWQALKKSFEESATKIH